MATVVQGLDVMDEASFEAINRLDEEDRNALDVALLRLREAVDRGAGSGEAEAELWRLREELLHWRRPAWAPSAASVADWFSVEDADYDQCAGPTRAGSRSPN